MSGDAEFGVVMPFIAVRSNGGPYEDEAFVAGFQMGALDHLLATALTASRVESPFFYDALREQADLIAMRYGWTTLEWRPTGDGMWASAVFIRARQP